MPEQFANIDDYISSFPNDVQTILNEVRRAIHGAVPGAGEAISYKIPTVTLDGRYLVYFAAWQHHLAIYPVPSGDKDFERELAPYRSGKGTVKFPFAKPIPYDLIERLVANLVRQRGNDAT